MFRSRKGPAPTFRSTGCRWYSEALLPSAFLRQSRRDSRAESWTHADGVIGHFNIGNGAKGNLTLHPDANHFVVLEAKMFSKLSSGVKNAPHFDQAARSVACIAEILKRAKRHPDHFASLGFYVVAPASQISCGVFADQLTKASVQSAIKGRIEGYLGEKDEWFSEWLLPVLEKLDIRAICWEDLIDYAVNHDADGIQLKEFYKRCLEYNKAPESRDKVEFGTGPEVHI